YRFRAQDAPQSWEQLTPKSFASWPIAVTLRPQLSKRKFVPVALLATFITGNFAGGHITKRGRTKMTPMPFLSISSLGVVSGFDIRYLDFKIEDWCIGLSSRG